MSRTVGRHLMLIIAIVGFGCSHRPVRSSRICGRVGIDGDIQAGVVVRIYAATNDGKYIHKGTTSTDAHGGFALKWDVGSSTGPEIVILTFCIPNREDVKRIRPMDSFLGAFVDPATSPYRYTRGPDSLVHCGTIDLRSGK